MLDCKSIDTPISKSDELCLEMCPKNQTEREAMGKVPYSSAVGSLMYAMMCTRPDICFCRWNGKPLPIQPRARTLEGCEEDFAVSKGDRGLGFMLSREHLETRRLHGC